MNRPTRASWRCALLRACLVLFSWLQRRTNNAAPHNTLQQFSVQLFLLSCFTRHDRLPLTGCTHRYIRRCLSPFFAERYTRFNTNATRRCLVPFEISSRYSQLAAASRACLFNHRARWYLPPCLAFLLNINHRHRDTASLKTRVA